MAKIMLKEGVYWGYAQMVGVHDLWNIIYGLIKVMEKAYWNRFIASTSINRT